MTTKLLGNPNSAFGYTTVDQTSEQDVKPYVLSAGPAGVVAVGDVVVFDVLTSNVAVTVHQADVSADDVALVAGIALEAGVTGDLIQVVRSGPTLVNIGNATIAAGDQATFHGSTDGAADGANADATTVAGDTFGVWLSANDVGGTNKALLDVRCS